MIPAGTPSTPQGATISGLVCSPVRSLVAITISRLVHRAQATGVPTSVPTKNGGRRPGRPAKKLLNLPVLVPATGGGVPAVSVGCFSSFASVPLAACLLVFLAFAGFMSAVVAGWAADFC